MSIETSNNRILLIYFDNNVTSAIAKEKSGLFKRNVDEVMQSKNLLMGRKEFCLVKSPALFLEQLGITTKPFIVQAFSFNDAEAWYAEVFKQAIGHFENNKELSIDWFKLKHEEESKYLNEEGKGIYRILMSNFPQSVPPDFLQCVPVDFPECVPPNFLG